MTDTPEFDYASLEDAVFPGGYSPRATAPEGCWFDALAARRACEFFPTFLVHLKGPLAGQPFHLLPWQRDVVATLFGWKRADGTRRYRLLLLFVARKNGKSTLAAGIALYLLACDGELGAEVYLAAEDKDQAKIVYRIASGQVKRNATLDRHIKRRPSYARLIHEASDSWLEAIPADGEGAHGLNPSAAVCDEVHLWPGRDLWEALVTGTGARTQPLIAVISTVGNDTESLCYELYSEGCDVRDGKIDDPELLPVIYEVPEDVDWRDEENWPRANPSIGYGVQVEHLRSKVAKARRNPALENAVRQLQFNQWVEAAVRWVSSERWEACALPADAWPDLVGLPSFGGLDLGESDDLSAFAQVWLLDGKVYVRVRQWCPSDAIAEAARPYRKRYRAWVQQGHLIETSGATTDYDAIEAAIAAAHEASPMRELGYDPWQAAATVNRLEAEGVPCVKVPQNMGGMAFGTKRTLELILDGDLVHDGSPLLAWNVAKTVPAFDASGNMRPDKRKSCGRDGAKGKIDGAVAAIIAIGRALVHQEPRSRYDDDDPREL